MDKKTSGTIKVLFFVALGLVLAWLSLRNIPAETLWENFKSVNPYWLGLSLAIGLLSHVIRALRWNMLLEPAGYRVKPMNAFMAVMAGYFINLALPRTGEIARCGFANRYDKVPLNTGIGTVVAERTVDMLLLLVLFGLNFLIGYQRLELYITEKFIKPLSEKISTGMLIIGFAAAILLVIAFIFYQKKQKAKQKEGKNKGLLEGFIDGLKSVATVKKPLQFALSSLAIWACYFLMLLVAFQAHPATAELGLEACLSVFVFGTIGMIVTPGGIGAYPALVGQTLALYGIAEDAGTSLGWILWGGQTIMFILLGPLSLIGFPVLNPQNNKKE